MNRDRVLDHLDHAKVKLESLIEDIHGGDEPESDTLKTLLPTIYHSLNRAWNERDLNHEMVADRDTDRFPEDLF